MQRRVDPFVSYLKSPSWKPFFLIESPPDFVIPQGNHLILPDIKIDLDKVSLEEVFWYIVGKKWLKQAYSQEDRDLVPQILSYLRKSADKIGFIPLSIEKNTKKKFLSSIYQITKKEDIPNSKLKYFNVETTFYCCVILYNLGKLNEIFTLLNGLIRTGLKKYIFWAIDQSSNTSSLKPGLYYFYLLSIAECLGIDPRNLGNQVKNTSLYSNQKGHSKLFQFLTYRYLGEYSLVEESSNLLYFHNKKVIPNGYSLSSSKISNDKDTFWIGYLFETFKWLMGYESNFFYTFIKNQFKKANLTLNLNSFSEIGEYIRAIILLGNIFSTLMDDLESLIFHHLQKRQEADLDILLEQSQSHGTENDFLQFMNKRFQFSLDIVNNEVRFRRYLNQLDPVKKHLAQKIYDLISLYLKADLTKFEKEENRGRSKKNRTEMKLFIELIHEMKTKLFIHGIIYKKKRFMAKNRHYFRRDNVIERILHSDRLIDPEQIRIEKHRLKEVITDIHSMTYQMEISTKNIMHEIESLIIVKIDPEFIENRLKFNINKTLFDAAFFNKAIDNFQAEFEFLDPNYYLNDYIIKWNQVFENLQQNFSNTHRILAIKIEELREEQTQYQQTVSLEDHSNNSIATLITSFDEFETEFRIKLLENYSRKSVLALKQELMTKISQLNEEDVIIRKKSLSITSKKKKIANLRKSVIDRWISQKKDFDLLIEYYLHGFEIWEKQTTAIDAHHKKIHTQIIQIEKEITQDIYANRHQAAIHFIESKFPQISKEIESFLKNLKKELESMLPKHRKLNTLVKNIISEANLQTVQLLKLIQHQRNELQANVQKDLQSHLYTDLSKYIDDRKNEIREMVIDLESILSQGMKTRFKENPQKNFEKSLENLKGNLAKNDLEIRSEKHQVESQTKTSSNEEILKLQNFWETFHKETLKEVANLNQKYWDDKIIYFSIQMAKESNSIILPLKKIARKLSLKSESLKKQLQVLIQNNRINAILLENPDRIEIHNSDWRAWQQLVKYNETHFREINYQFNKIQKYQEQLIKNNDFLNKKDQIEQLLTRLKEDIKDNLLDHDIYISQFNLQNQIIKDEVHKYNQDIGVIQKNIEKILASINSAKDLESFLAKHTVQVEDYVNSEIHRLSSNFERRKHTSLIKNLKWLKEQEVDINSQFKNIIQDVNDQIRLNNLEAIQSLSAELNGLFSQQTNVFKDDFGTFITNLQEKFLDWEIVRVKASVESILQKAQEKMTFAAHKVDLAIVSRIRRKDFIVAAKLLRNRSRELKSVIKPWNKRISKEFKNIIKVSQDLKIKQIPLYKSQWEYIQNEFIEVSIESQYMALLTELVLQFTKFSMRSFKQNYVPLKTYNENLHLKHKIVEQTLKTLITDGQLPGQLDLTTDIYFEGSDAPGSDIIAKLNIIKNTNVKTYLFLERLKNVSKLLYPILTVIGSILGIIFNITRLSNNLFVYFGLFAFIIFTFGILLWIRRGKKKISK